EIATDLPGFEPPAGPPRFRLNRAETEPHRARLLGTLDAGLADLRREHRREGGALTLGHRPDLLVLRQPDREQDAPAPGSSPAPLAHQQLAHRHALRFPRTAQDHLGRIALARSNLTLQRRSREPDSIGSLECPQMLWP